MFANWFKPKIQPCRVRVDMHSHLIPEIDDGVDSYEEAIEMIRQMLELGYSKFVTTPHIMGDFYKNSPDTILPRLEKLRSKLVENGLDVEIEAAAEYYLDEWFVKKLSKNEPIMTMGDNFVLVETSYINRPQQLEQVLFDLKTSGYKPILAHPERYTYMYNDFENYTKLFDTGVYFQLNINSLSGYYSKAAKKISQELIKKRMVHFIGTDLHGPRHIEALKNSMKTKAYRRLGELEILNDTLFS